MKEKIRNQVNDLFESIPPDEFQQIAAGFEKIWLEYKPKSTGGIKKELQGKQKNVGAPVDVLRSIGGEAGKYTSRDVKGFIPLTTLLWDEYGREGRIVSSVALGKMELKDPERVLPLIKKLCKSCITWEDCDVLAMRALEPIIRKDPDHWFDELKPWLRDDNKWVKRAGVMVVGRLPMKHPAFTRQCLDLMPLLLHHQDKDVQKGVSFAIRLCARGDISPVVAFLKHHVPPEDPTATWVLCDVIRSMTKRFLPEFKELDVNYQTWADDPSLSSVHHKSINSALKILKSV